MPDPKAAPTGLVVAAFIAVYLIWGSTYLAIRWTIETIPPYLSAGIRFIVAGGIMYGWLRARGAPAPKRVHWRSATIVGALMLLGGNGTLVWAEQFVASGIASLIIATVPLWLVVTDRVLFRAAPIRPLAWLGILVGLIGVAMLANPSAGEVTAFGVTILVAASLSWAIGSHLSHRLPHPDHGPTSIAQQMLMGGVLLTMVGLATGELLRFDVAAVSTKSWLSLAYLILFGALIGYTSYIWILRVSTTAKVATYAYVNPVVALFLGWWLASEPFTLQTALASLLILGAVALITSVKTHKRDVPGDRLTEDATAEPTT